MKINGMNIEDIKDAQDILAALETIRLSLENLSGDLAKNYDEYTNLNNDINNNITTQKDFIYKVENLQSLEKNIMDNLTKIDNNLKTNSKKIKSNLDDTFMQIQNLLNNAIDNIDTNKITREIQEILQKKIVYLNDEADNIKTITDKLKQQTDKLKEQENELHNTINELDYRFENINFLFISIAFILGLSIGFGAGYFLIVHFLKIHSL